MSTRVTYYLEVISSWCYWVEPAWAELKHRYAGRVEFVWKIALMDPAGLPTSIAQEEWFYRRSGTIMRSPFMLNTGWFEPGRPEYLPANAVAEAAKDLGITDDRVRLALTHAALRDGQRVGEWDVAAEIGAHAADTKAGILLARAKSPEVEARLRASTTEFHALQVTQRPAFLIEDSIGDRAIFSGIVAIEPLVATIEAMLQDTAAYTAYAAHHGTPPPA